MNNMGMFATLKGEQFQKCPQCGKKAEWQSKQLHLTYKDREIWIGYEHEIELDENINGEIKAYCWKFTPNFDGCGKVTTYKIENGTLIEQSIEDK